VPPALRETIAKYYAALDPDAGSRRDRRHAKKIRERLERMHAVSP